MISANIKPANDAASKSIALRHQDLQAKRLKVPLKIAFIGLTDVPPDDQTRSAPPSGFTIEDPIATARTVIAEVADKADITVIVGYLKMTTANRIAAQNDDLDVIIASDGRGLVPDPSRSTMP